MKRASTTLSSATWPAVMAGAALLAGCLGPSGLDSAADPLVVTEASTDAAVAADPAGAMAVAEMRAQAIVAADLPYPDAFQAEQTLRLAAREEPLAAPDAAAIEAEIAAIARAEKGAIGASELAALKAREAELRRLLAVAQAGTLR